MEKQIELSRYGWNSFFENNFLTYKEEGYQALRVGAVYPDRVELLGNQNPCQGLFSGKFRMEIQLQQDQAPVSGDWVYCRPIPGEEKFLIEGILPRKNCFRRQEAGDRTALQNLVSNLDYLMICTGLDGDFNLHRIERFLITAWEGGITPVVILTKCDLIEDPHAPLEQVKAISGAAEVLGISSVEKTGLESLSPFLQPGMSLALTGSSGCGKSTLVNALMGQEVQKTQQVRGDDSRGRHTTTNRSLHILPSGAIIIDTPGLREIQLWDIGSKEEFNPFQDIEEIGSTCKFKDCSHRHEPGCSLRTAVENGDIPESRLQEYLDFMDEISMTREKRIQRKHQWEKDIAARLRNMKKFNKREGR